MVLFLRTANKGFWNFWSFWSWTIMLSVLYRWTISKSYQTSRNKASIKLTSLGDVTDERTNLRARFATAAILKSYRLIYVFFLFIYYLVKKELSDSNRAIDRKFTDQAIWQISQLRLRTLNSWPSNVLPDFCSQTASHTLIGYFNNPSINNSLVDSIKDSEKKR